MSTSTPRVRRNFCTDDLARWDSHGVCGMGRKKCFLICSVQEGEKGLCVCGGGAAKARMPGCGAITVAEECEVATAMEFQPS